MEENEDGVLIKDLSILETLDDSDSIPVWDNSESSTKKTLFSIIFSKIKNVILDSVFYKGYVLITLNSSFNPNNVYPGTWERLPAGVFIRNSGGDAGTVGQTQVEGLPNITGNLPQGFYAIGGGQSWSGAFAANDVGDLPVVTTSVWGAQLEYKNQLDVYFNAAGSTSIYGSSNHVTPYNMACYMWKRTN